MIVRLSKAANLLLTNSIVDAALRQRGMNIFKAIEVLLQHVEDLPTKDEKDVLIEVDEEGLNLLQNLLDVGLRSLGAQGIVPVKEVLSAIMVVEKEKHSSDVPIVGAEDVISKPIDEDEEEDEDEDEDEDEEPVPQPPPTQKKKKRKMRLVDHSKTR